MPRWTAALLAVVIGSLVALPASAQWKWRDRTGRVQYSDLPPPADVADKDILLRPAAAQRLLTAPGPASSAASGASSGASAPLAVRGVDPELDAKRKQAEQVDADKRKAEEAKLAAAKADNCTRARSEQRTLDSGIRIARVNAQGEREVMDDSARASEARRVQDAVSANCR